MNKIFYKRIINKISYYPRVLLSLIGVKRKYQVNNYAIQIDFTHRLPDYQNRHRSYDKFIPHFVRYLPKNTLVIDVGANVGDTLVGMLGNNDNLEYLCIEASDDFFSELKNNKEYLMSQNSELQISVVNALVGKEITNVGLSGTETTSHAVIGEGCIKSKTLVSILSDLGMEHSRLSFLKVDVDGFDWDVIRSSYEVINHKPYLYFETECNNLEQLKSYKELFSEMISMGYSKFSFFDNFGQYLLSTDNLTEINELLNYVRRQFTHNCTKTYKYYDVLAYSNDKCDKVNSIIAEYNNL